MADNDLINAHLNEAKASIDKAQALLDVTPPPEPPTTEPPLTVKPGDNLLSVLEQAPAGATVLVDPAYEANLQWWTIKKPVTLMGALQPAPGRVSPDASLPTLRGLLTVDCPDVTLGSLRLVGQVRDGTLLTTGPNLTVERCVILGSPDGQHRGIAMNDPNVKVLRCHIANVWNPNQDSQALCGWTKTKNCLVEDNFLQASGENVIFGGSDSGTEADSPQDVLLLNNHLHKPYEWKATASCKNLYELKNARRIIFRGGLMEYSFLDSQTGYAVVLTVRASEANNTWATVEDCTIEDCTIRHMGSAVQVLGRETAAGRQSQIMTRMTIRRVTFEDINPAAWGNGGRQFQIIGPTVDFHVEDCTLQAVGIGSAIILDGHYADGTPFLNEGFRFTGTRIYEGTYGVMGARVTTDKNLPTSSLNKFCPGWVWENVTMVRTLARPYVYPPGTTIVQETATRGAKPITHHDSATPDPYDNTDLVMSDAR